MREVYLLRHAEKDTQGILTDAGQSQARELGKIAPRFAMVYASPSDRAQLTARLISGSEPLVDERADFYMASPVKSDAINELATLRKIPFLNAVQEYGDSEVITGIEQKATELNALVDGLFAQIHDDEKCLIVSHDLTISPAMAQRGISFASIDFLSGYVIDETGGVTPFEST